MMIKTLLLVLSGVSAFATPLTVRLVANLPSPQPVGSVIGLLPRVDNATPGKYVYRYSVSTANGPFRIVRDFSQDPSFAWTPDLYEHDARLRVTVRNNATKETSNAELPYKVVSRQMDANGAVTRTSNPLVALFSAPACPEGAQFRVGFERQGDNAAAHTSAESCRGTLTNNILVAGMRADTEYRMRAEILRGSNVKCGSWIPFRTGMLDGIFPVVKAPAPAATGSSRADDIVIRSAPSLRSTATDLDGNLLWYLSSSSGAFLTRMIPGGRFLLFADGDNSENDMKRLQLVREVDLAGNTIRETNISRVAEDLESRGIHSDCKRGGQQCVSGFHHEAIRLPNGHTIVIAGLERMFPSGTQGSEDPVDVLGDLVLDLDQDFQLTWAWNSFDHMDLKRASLGNEKCRGGPGDDGCPPVFLADKANGWLHTNSLAYIPRTGDLLLSVPEQDWLIKIDYRDGKGDGKVLWRLGQDGDFSVKSSDPYPWFSYQHDAGFNPESNLLVLLDDGTRRKKKDPKGNNRGQVWKLDEDTRQATLVLNADLGVFSVAVGSAQALSNGNYSFESGFINPGPAGMSAIYSQTTETSPDGKILFAQQAEGTLTYRSFRVPDMYTAPRK